MVSRTTTTAADFLPESRSLSAMRKAVQECQGCELFRNATQAVFGEGPASAAIMLVGEQPGDSEDLQGHPFVGPAGRLLHDVAREAGVSEDELYITNAVKHFKWESQGSHRLHKKPGAREIHACHPWLEAELEAVAPKIVVCLGATAAQALMGRDFRVSTARGKIQTGARGPAFMATWHPSAVLRAPDADRRALMRQEMVADLTASLRYIRQ